MNRTSTKSTDDFVTDFDRNQQPSEAVVEAVATVEDTSPSRLEPRLYDALDPDALNSLMVGQPSPERIVFSYLDYEVVVRRDGHIRVE